MKTMLLKRTTLLQMDWWWLLFRGILIDIVIGLLFSVLPERAKFYHSLINIALTSRHTESSDNIFSLLLRQLLCLWEWSIWSISTIQNTFGLFMQEEWTNSTFLITKNHIWSRGQWISRRIVAHKLDWVMADSLPRQVWS